MTRSINSRTSRLRAAITVGVALIVATAGAGSAVAIPDPGDPVVPAPAVNSRALRRIGTQLFYGDDLTGLGVVAPSWVPEWGTPDTTAPISPTATPTSASQP